MRNFLAFLFFAFSLAACDDTISNSKDIVFPDSKVSFQQHVYPFIKLNCAYAGGHNEASVAGNIDMSTYTSLFITPGLVDVEPDHSRIIQVLEGTLPHYTYFYTGYITTNHITGMRTWMKEGAKNN